MLPIFYRVILMSLCAVFALTGCGGGGGGGTPTTATPSVAVAWPERSRAVDAPSSALSVRFVLDPTEASLANVEFVGNRGANIAAHIANYTPSSATRVGEYALQATFYADADAAGETVGTAGATVRLQANGTLTKADGTPLGNLGFTGKVAAVTLAEVPDMRIGDEVQLAAEAADEAENPLVLSPGSFLYTVLSGSSNVSVTKEGVAKALHAGTATVRVAVDGVTSETLTITVLEDGPAPSVTVAWPERSRNLSAPSSAQSVQIVLDPVAAGEPNITIAGDRNANIAAHSETYTATTQGETGEYTLQALFFPGTQAQGPAVGIANAPVRLQQDGTLTKPDGSPLGTIGFTGMIASVSILPDQTVGVGNTNHLLAYASDAVGNPIVVSDGSFIFTVTEGGTHLSVTKNGLATGLAQGIGRVTVSIDGVTSAPETVTVIGDETTVDLLFMKANDIFYDATRGAIYASTEEGVYGIDAATGDHGAPYHVGAGQVAVSENGQYLYVSDGGNINRVVLATGQVDLTIQETGHWRVDEILPVPGQPSAIVANRYEAIAGIFETRIYDGATARPKTARLGRSVAVWSDGSKIFGFDHRDGANEFIVAALDATGITVETTTPNLITGATTRIVTRGGRIVSDNGTILWPVPPAVEGQIQFNTPNNVVVGLPNIDRAHFFLWGTGGYRLETYDLGTRGRVGQVALPGLSGDIAQGIYAGPGRAAFRTADGANSKIGIVKDLQ